MPPKEEQAFIQSQSRLSWVSAGKEPPWCRLGGDSQWLDGLGLSASLTVV